MDADLVRRRTEYGGCMRARTGRLRSPCVIRLLSLVRRCRPASGARVSECRHATMVFLGNDLLRFPAASVMNGQGYQRLHDY